MIISVGISLIIALNSFGDSGAILLDQSRSWRSIVDTGVGGGGTSDFKSTCFTTPARVDLCWGRWGA
jgi:hypothetical protein